MSARAASAAIHWLDCGKHRAANGRRQLHRREERFGEEIILTGFVNNAKEPIERGGAIGDGAINLAALERRLVPSVLQAEDKI